MLRNRTFVLFLMLATGCSAEVTPSSPAPSPSSTSSTSPSTPTGNETPATSTPSKDAGAPTDTGSPIAMLTISSATYLVTKAGTTTTAIDIELDLENVAKDAVTSIEDMSFDFGSGQKVALNQPACGGSFPIAAGATKTIAVRMVVSADGDVMPAGFSMKCPSSQSFGAGDGTAPSDTGFSGSVAIRIEGKTKNGTFSASGNAARAE